MSKLKYGILTIIAVIFLIVLTGCGNSTIIATQESSDNMLGKYSQKIEVDFEGDTISIIKLTMTFEDENIANIIADSSDEINITKEGKTVYIELSAEKYKELYDMDFTVMSKEDIISDLEEDGFVIEKK